MFGVKQEEASKRVSLPGLCLTGKSTLSAHNRLFPAPLHSCALASPLPGFFPTPTLH